MQKGKQTSRSGCLNKQHRKNPTQGKLIKAKGGETRRNGLGKKKLVVASGGKAVAGQKYVP